MHLKNNFCVLDCQGPSPVTTDDDAFWASLGVPQSGLSPPVEPHQPLVRSDKPQFTLLHVEHWRAKFSGSKAIESSVLGEVATCPKALPMRTRFQLKPPSNCPQGLEHSLRSSSVKKGIANGGGKGIFEGDASVGSVLLRYKLWPGSFLEPVVFRLSTGRLYEGKENDRVIVLLIEFAASSDLVGSASGEFFSSYCLFLLQLMGIQTNAKLYSSKLALKNFRGQSQKYI